ncbi:MAG TPA: tetratricopeptide repeat protein [Fimbriimonadaceae bacterium]|jgi:tetratricopeptide (TPR) repeat protein
MSHEQARQFVNEAGEAIRKGQFQEALNSLERSIALDSSDSEAFVLQAVAYSHLQEPEKATESFRQAISLAPLNQKAYYNFAVHLYSLDKKEEALAMAKEAIRLDPHHGSSIELAQRIEKETGVAPSIAAPPQMAPPPEIPSQQSQPDLSAPPQIGGYYRGGYYDYPQPVHSLRFVENMGKGWDWIGWGLAVAGIGGLIRAFTFLSRFNQIMQQMQSGGDPFAIQAQSGSLAASLFFDFVYLMIIVYMCFDIADRRENWLWMVPNALACCFGGNALILAVYLLFGRRTR